MADGEPAFSIPTRRRRGVVSPGVLALVALAGPSLTMTPPGKSRTWVWLHWAIAVSPFALVLALSVWGYERYAWMPLVGGLLCPVGAALVGLQLKRDRARAKAR